MSGVVVFLHRPRITLQIMLEELVDLKHMIYQTEYIVSLSLTRIGMLIERYLSK